MRVDIVAIGSRGDVQPYIALAIGMQRAGFDVRVVTLEGFEESIRKHGLNHLAIAASPFHIANTAAGKEWVKERKSTSGFARGFVQVAGALIEQAIATYWANCDGLQAIVVSGMATLVGIHIAERLRIPLIRSGISPFAHTSYDWDGHKSVGTILRGQWRTIQAVTFQGVIWTLLRSSTNRARKHTLGLPPLSLRGPFRALDQAQVLMLDAYSAVVVKRPPDWGPWIHVTGYWFLDEASTWTPPEELVSFLEAGPAPIFIGFGSTPFPNPEASTQVIIRALQRTGRRGVILAGGSGLATGQLTIDVLSLDSVPHDWLFSRVCAAVHHGGAGATAAALRAGLPSVVVPVFADQPFWGDRVFKLGAGPRPLPAQQLTEEALSSAIQAATGKEMRDRAVGLSKLLSEEDGVTKAVKVIQQYLATSTTQLVAVAQQVTKKQNEEALTRG